MTQAMVTIAIRIAVEVADKAAELIDALGNPAGSVGDKIADPAKEEFLHFASMHVIRSHKMNRAFILLELSADGTASHAIDALVARIGDDLLPIFQLADHRLTKERLGAYLRGYAINVGYTLFQPAGLPFSGVPGMSVPRIKREQVLAEKIAALLASHGASSSALASLEAIKRVLAADPDAAWALDPPPPPAEGPTNEPGLLDQMTALLPGFVTIFLAPLLVVALPIAAWFAWPLGGWSWSLLALVRFVLFVGSGPRSSPSLRWG